MSFADDRDHAGHRRWRITRRADECHGVKKIRTVIPHAHAPSLSAALAACTLVVTMIEAALVRLPVPSVGCSLGLGARSDLANRPAELLSPVAGPADTEHELTSPTALEAKLLVVVHRLLPRRRKTCSGRQRRASCAQSRRPSAEGLELVTRGPRSFGVLAEPDPNGEIFDAATFSPTGSTARTRRNQAAINTPCTTTSISVVKRRTPRAITARPPITIHGTRIALSARFSASSASSRRRSPRSRGLRTALDVRPATAQFLDGTFTHGVTRPRPRTRLLEHVQGREVLRDRLHGPWPNCGSHL